MVAKSNLVNLDAMIKRADFASEEDTSTFETFNNIPARELSSDGLTGKILRKPDFQRETNHWTPNQVVSLLECYINGDLIPSVILWKSPSYLFVIDGGHRLSVIRAWIEDDYGDGPISHQLFGHNISQEQKRAAERTRKLVKERVGTWSHFKTLISEDDDLLTSEQRKMITTLTTRGLPVQWVQGDADKAETSFFNINTKGTPLDDIEELLLKNRKKPIPIAARAIIRAGRGHRYWSAYSEQNKLEIEHQSVTLHKLLFNPEINNPIKTLDLPLSGSKGVRTAIQILIDFLLISIRTQSTPDPKIVDLNDDIDGNETINVLKKAVNLASKITGNTKGSLGLHPAIYFYGPTGRHSSPMFLGLASLISEKIANNDKDFFKRFSNIREGLESVLITNKELIAAIIQKHISRDRVRKHKNLLNQVINELQKGNQISEDDLIKFSELDGKLIAGNFNNNAKISDDVKSKVFIASALESAIKCPICFGYLDTQKSISYDHITPVRDGGLGTQSNCQMTHPYCNQSIKS